MAGSRKKPMNIFEERVRFYAFIIQFYQNENHLFCLNNLCRANLGLTENQTKEFSALEKIHKLAFIADINWLSLAENNPDIIAKIQLQIRLYKQFDFIIKKYSQYWQLNKKNYDKEIELLIILNKFDLVLDSFREQEFEPSWARKREAEVFVDNKLKYQYTSFSDQEVDCAQYYVHLLRAGNYFEFLKFRQYLLKKYMRFLNTKDYDQTKILQKLILHELSKTDISIEDLKKLQRFYNIYAQYSVDEVHKISAEVLGLGPNIIEIRKIQPTRNQWSARYYANFEIVTQTQFNLVVNHDYSFIEQRPEFQSGMMATKEAIEKNNPITLRAVIDYSRSFINSPLYKLSLLIEYLFKIVKLDDLEKVISKIIHPVNKKQFDLAFCKYMLINAETIRQQQVHLYCGSAINARQAELAKSIELPQDINGYRSTLPSIQQQFPDFIPPQIIESDNAELVQNQFECNISPTLERKRKQKTFYQASKEHASNIQQINSKVIIKYLESLQHYIEIAPWHAPFSSARIIINNQTVQVPTNVAEIYKLLIAYSIKSEQTPEEIFNAIIAIAKESKDTFHFFRRKHTQQFYQTLVNLDLTNFGMQKNK